MEEDPCVCVRACESAPMRTALVGNARHRSLQTEHTHKDAPCNLPTYGTHTSPARPHHTFLYASSTPEPPGPQPPASVLLGGVGGAHPAAVVRQRGLHSRLVGASRQRLRGPVLHWIGWKEGSKALRAPACGSTGAPPPHPPRHACGERPWHARSKLDLPGGLGRNERRSREWFDTRAPRCGSSPGAPPLARLFTHASRFGSATGRSREGPKQPRVQALRGMSTPGPSAHTRPVCPPPWLSGGPPAKAPGLHKAQVVLRSVPRRRCLRPWCCDRNSGRALAQKPSFGVQPVEACNYI